MNLKILDTYKAALTARNYAAKTKSAYMKAFRTFFLNFSGQINDLTSQQINDHLNSLNFSPSKLIAFTAAIKFYYENCLDRTIRTTKIIRHETTPVILTQAEIKKLLDSCETLQLKTLFSCIYYLGLRRQEAADLQTADISSDKIIIKDSKGADRILATSQELQTILSNYKSSQILGGSFFNLTAGQIAYFFRDTLRKAGINKPATPHDLRHSVAVHLLDAGFDLISISRFLGHKSLTSTQIYLKFATNTGITAPSLNKEV